VRLCCIDRLGNMPAHFAQRLEGGISGRSHQSFAAVMRTMPLCPLSIMEACMAEMNTAACILVNCQRTTEAMRERRRVPRVGSLEVKPPRRSRPSHDRCLSHSWRRSTASDLAVMYGQSA
jgi:hypothetical protein